MQFEDDLSQILPLAFPHRAKFIHQSAQYLSLVAEANEYMNLTRITSSREAAVKHVFDSAYPWHLFSSAVSVLDAGTGAGFPGIPLALALPEVQFTLCESIQKKARFVQSVVDALSLPNVEVVAERAETILLTARFDIITARAVAPLERALSLFAGGLKRSTRALLYKGPDVETEIAACLSEARKRRLTIQVIERYQLPDELGSRTIVEMRNAG